jgi:hypothetical protein
MAVRIPPARTTLRLNGLTSGAAGLLVLAAGVPLAGTAAPLALGVAGLLLIYGVEAMTLSVRRGLHRSHVLGLVLIDVLVVGTGTALLLQASDTLTTAGRAVVALTAVLVAVFLLMQVRAARSL